MTEPFPGSAHTDVPQFQIRIEQPKRLCCTWCSGRIYPDETYGRDRRVVGYDCDSCPARWDGNGDVINDGVGPVAS